ncbi:response regulator transcription factor [Gulosibacter molinativorax]|uniref:DNA-binding response regulator n=1 Tax=Gulosibacter molinativorax TaxID=256821 RepID=A0ABT7C718_9MICO|nr:response regulator transcription factor [Gulosibacter molinativorax]MDJ1370990.1 DNA-binding response regulator [Gulosibacter molinativorax]QUY62782.1 LuxR family transcriptional regulator [Gulosibacter molinativorax]
MIRVAIVDDHELVRDGLRTIIGSEPDIEVVGELADGANVARFAAENNVDVVLLDIAMPGVDGIQAARETALESPATTVIMLTTLPDSDNVRAALQAGAHGYLIKTSSATELIQAVRDAHRGRRSFAPSVLDQLAAGFAGPGLEEPGFEEPGPEDAGRGAPGGRDEDARLTRGAPDARAEDSGPGRGSLGRGGLDGPGQASGQPGVAVAKHTDIQSAPIPPELASLTERELQVFREVGRGRSNAEIGETLFLSEKTVKTYVTRILSKVGLASRVQAVVLAFETGFVTRQN